MVNNEKGKVNYYKYATFAILGVLVLYGIFYGFTSYKQSVFEDGFISGQNNAVFGMIDVIAKEGYITFTNDNNASLTLVPSQELQRTRDGTVLEIMNYIKKEGYVTLYNNESQITLIEYKEQTQAQES